MRIGKRRIDFRHVLLAVFSFSMVAVLSFLAVRNLDLSNAYTSGFKAGNIISDAAMRDYNSLSEADIQRFLKSKNSCNDTNLSKTGNNVNYLSENSPYSWHVKDGHYVCMADETFNGGTAAHIIYRAAQDYHINPKVLIVLLEKEQSLVRDTFPNSVQYRSATGFGCPDTAACDSQYYGLNNQIRNAASMFNTVLNGGWTNYPVGWNYIQYNPKSSCGGSNVYIENLATSALYRYTPYQPGGDAGNDCAAYGNINFYNFYTDWFGSTQQVFKASDLDNIYLPNGTYQIRTLSGLGLATKDSGTANGANVQISAATSDNNQKFKITRQSDGFYKIQHVASGRYLDVYGASVLPAANINLWDGNNSCAQKWAITLKNNHYIFRNACSGNALDVYGGGIGTAGSNVDVYTYHGKDSELWDLISASAAPIADGNYVILSSSGRALDIYGAKTGNGANANLWEPHRGKSEQFTLTRATDGYYRITNVNAKKSLDVYGASTKAGANVNLWADNNSCSQKWVLSANKYGIYTIRNACSGNALDVYGNYVGKNGANVDVWTYHGGASEQWTIVPVDQTYSEFLSGTYRINAISGNQTLDVYGAKTNNGANINTWSIHTGKSEDFVFKSTGDGYFRIVNPAANKSLDVYGASTKAGANVDLWANNNSCSQKWYLMPYDDKYFIRNACSGNALDIYGGQFRSGSNVDAYTFHGGNSELWDIVKK